MALSSLALFAVEAHAQSAFIEGHVFNFQTRRPIENATAEVRVFCAPPCLGPPGGTVAGSDSTDPNGFYEVGLPSDVLDRFLPGANIIVRCPTPGGLVVGVGSATLRDDTIRRDIYLKVPAQLVRCSSGP